MFNIIPYRTNRMMPDRPNHFMNPFADDFFRSFFGDHFGNDFPMVERPMKVDVRDEGDHFLMEADLPGIERENLHIDVKNGVMTLTAEINKTEEKNENNYVFRERHFGKTSRSFGLDGINEEGITAEFKDGVLKLTLPKAVPEAADDTRSIPIN